MKSLVLYEIHAIDQGTKRNILWFCAHKNFIDLSANGELLSTVSFVA